LYLAVQEPFARRVVVKTIRPDRDSPQTRQRFQRERDVLARLHQADIIPIYAAGVEEGLHYFAMPYLEGAALHHVIRTASQLKMTEPASQTPTLAELVGRLTPAGGSPEETAAPSPSPVEARCPGRLRLSAAYFRSVARVVAATAEALQHAH